MKRTNKLKILLKQYRNFIVFLDYEGYRPDQYYCTNIISIFGRFNSSSSKQCRTIGKWFNRARGQSLIPFIELYKNNKVMDFIIKNQILFSCSVKSLTRRLYRQAIFFSNRETLEHFLEILNEGRNNTDKVVLTEDVKKALCRYPIRKKPSPLDLCKP